MFSSYSSSVAFPELAFPTVAFLKKFIKTNKVPAFTKKMGQLLDQIQRNTQYVQAQRDKSEFKPSEIDNVKQFLSDDDKSPLAQFYRNWKTTEDRLKQLKQQGEEDEDEDMSDEEDEEDQPPKKKTKTDAKQAKASNNNQQENGKSKPTTAAAKKTLKQAKRKEKKAERKYVHSIMLCLTNTGSKSHRVTRMTLLKILFCQTMNKFCLFRRSEVWREAAPLGLKQTQHSFQNVVAWENSSNGIMTSQI